MSTDVQNEVIAALHAGMDADEAAAKAATPGPWETETHIDDYEPVGVEHLVTTETHVVAGTGLGGDQARADAEHIARHDPARTLREAAAIRSLIAAILAEPHDYIPGDSWYSRSQAVVPDPADDEDRMPGSGCLDDTRRGQPCDCGRDARAGRLLSILAGIYDETGDEQR